MESKTKDLLDIFIAQETKDIPKQIEQFEKITDTLFKLTQSLFDNKVKIAYYQSELEGKLFRHGLANQSIITLLKGNKFKLINNDSSIIDVFSLNSITRMQIESYLIIFYLIFDKIPTTEKNFRYDIYKIHALRKQLTMQIGELPEKKSYLSKIKTELNQSITNIEKSSIFKNANPKLKEKYLNPGFAKLIKSKIIFETSGLNDSRLNQMWELYSNYAHCEHISDRQYNTIYRIEKTTINNSSLSLMINSILTSKIILDFCEEFSVVEKKYSEIDLSIRNYIEYWGKIDLNPS